MLLSLLLISCAPSIRYVRGTEEGVDVALNGAWKGREFSLVSPRYGRLDQAHTTGRHLYFDLPIDIDSSTLDSRLYVQDHDYTLGLRGHRGDYIFENNAWIATIRCKRALKDIRTHPDPAAVKAACADASSLRSAQAAGDQLLRAELELRAVQQRVQEAKTALSRTVRHLTAAEARLWENDQWLRQESAVWVGGSCVAPPAAPPPKMPLQACQPSEAGSFGLAVCGAIYMASNGVPFTKFDGCGELGELARQKSNEGWAKMVDAADSTVCEAALNYYFGRSTSDDEVLQDLA
ncbi:MAG TPA: hypothetical protein PKW90_27270, partial [Myxococcota bacterium]|nr:hypothetical protein [Myxococcota bacterium]